MQFGILMLTNLKKKNIITLTSIPFKSLFQDITHSVISHFTCLLNGTTQTH